MNKKVQPVGSIELVDLETFKSKVKAAVDTFGGIGRLWLDVSIEDIKNLDHQRRGHCWFVNDLGQGFVDRTVHIFRNGKKKAYGYMARKDYVATLGYKSAPYVYSLAKRLEKAGIRYRAYVSSYSGDGEVVLGSTWGGFNPERREFSEVVSECRKSLGLV